MLNAKLPNVNVNALIIFRLMDHTILNVYASIHINSITVSLKHAIKTVVKIAMDLRVHGLAVVVQSSVNTKP